MIMSSKKNILVFTAFTISLFLNAVQAQTTYGDTIFFENFGQHSTRVTTLYMPAGSYSFASASGTSNEREIQDNYYAIVDPLHIIDANPTSYFWTSTSPTATVPAGAAPYYTKDHTGDVNGAVMVVNAGNTVNYLYKRNVSLKTGFRYRLSFWIYLVRKSSQFAMEVINLTKITLNSFAGPILNNEGVWAQYTLDFPVPLSATDSTNIVSAGLQNKYSLISGNDYYIDDILLSTLHTDTLAVKVSNSSPACQKQSILFNSNVTGGAPPFIYSWTGPNGFTSTLQNPGLTNCTLAMSGIYSLTVTDAIGQKASATISVIVNPTPASDFTLSGSTIDIRHNSVDFSIAPEGNVVYNWDFGDGITYHQLSVTHAFAINGNSAEFTVKLTATDTIGCNSTFSKTIEVVPFVPNFFSPNGDGVNDVFMDGFELQVFDRYGMLLYKGTTGWDGTFNGKKMDNDTYFYYLNYSDKNHIIQTRKGFVTLQK